MAVERVNMSRVSKLDNDGQFSSEKLWLRREAIRRLGEPRTVRVLDAYHGHGVMWDQVRRDTADAGWTLKVFGMDKEKRSAGTLRADNARVLASLDLSRFDIIDLDAYGWPVEQVAAVAERGQQAMVAITRIQILKAMADPPKRILDDLGIATPKDSPDFLGYFGVEFWDAWLNQLGWRYSLRYVHEKGPNVKCYELLLPPDTTRQTVAGLDTVDL